MDKLTWKKYTNDSTGEPFWVSDSRAGFIIKKEGNLALLTYTDCNVEWGSVRVSVSIGYNEFAFGKLVKYAQYQFDTRPQKSENENKEIMHRLGYLDFCAFWGTITPTEEKERAMLKKSLVGKNI